MTDFSLLNNDMQQRLLAYVESRQTLAANLHGYDELLNASGAVRSQWQPVLDELAKLDRDTLRSRCEETQNLLHENGVTFNAYEDDPGQLRSWQLDSLPYVISTEDWEHLEQGLKQRSRLLEAIAEDLYGTRTLISSGLLPAELIHTFPSYLLPIVSDQPLRRPMLILHGTDVIRNASGEWEALCDWTQSPSGAGYALENRITLARAFPNQYREAPLKRLAGFLQAQHRALAALSTSQRDQPNIVLLSPGPGSPGYFEHAWLANYMNFSLVEGADLVVRDGQVAMRTLGGLKQVDVIVRHINDPWCDPLELRGDSLLGVPGLMQAARDGEVEIANALGTGILENPALAAYLDKICQQLLNEPLILKQRKTLWAGNDTQLAEILTTPDQWLFKDITEPAKLIRTEKLSDIQRLELLDKLQHTPWRYVAQSKPKGATSPTYETRTDTFEARNVNLRFFSLIEPDHLFIEATDRHYRIMPGGLAWVGEPGTLLMESRTVKDIWVMAPVPQPHISMLRQANGPIVMTRDGTDLACRVADSLFWMGRYGERLDIRARLLREVLGRFLQEDQFAEESGLLPDLFTALEIQFPEIPDTEELTDFDDPLRHKQLYLSYRNRLLELFEESHPDGMPWLFNHFLRNCRSVRDHLGDDAWRTVNNLRQRFNDMPRTQGIIVGQRQLEGVVTHLAAFFGLCNETMPHHYGWRFLDIGRFIERVLCTLELLKLALLTARQPGIPLFEVVLATTDNFTVYRRRYRSQLHPSAILDLLLFDETNPRSVGYILKRLERQIQRLPKPSNSPYRNLESRLVIQATSALHLVDIDTLSQIETSTESREVLSALLDQLIQPLSELTNAISHSHFSHVEAPIQLVTMQS